MRTAITTPYVDTRAADLSYAVGLSRLDALDVLTVPGHPGGRLELRLLGASHQAVLAVDGYEYSEVVACLPGATGPVPTTHRGAWGTLRYDFRSEVRTLPLDGLAGAVADLRRRYGGSRDALIGEFPGRDDAVTVLSAEPSGVGVVRWRTWHAYPQTGELVTTRSVVGRSDEGVTR